MGRFFLALVAFTASLFFLAQPAKGSASPIRFTATATKPAPISQEPAKKDILSRLKRLQDQQIADSAALDSAIKRQLQETLSMDVGSEDLSTASRRTSLITKKIDELNKRRSELSARREIVDRLIFQVDTKWTPAQKLQTFLEQTFIEMAAADLADGRDSRLWKAFTYLSMVMREVPEQNEDVVAVFQGYLGFSSLLDPKTPAEFIASRNYTNGSESTVARASARDSLGDGMKLPGPTPVRLEIRTSYDREAGEVKPLASETAPAASGTPSGTMSGTSQSARDLTAPASEGAL